MNCSCLKPERIARFMASHKKALKLSQIYHFFEATTESSKASIRGAIYYNLNQGRDIFVRKGRGQYALK